MTMSKSLMSCLGIKVSQLKVMCGLSLDFTAHEERAINSVVSDPVPSNKFLGVYRQRLQRKQLAIEFKALSRNQEEHSSNAALRNVLLNNKQEVVPYDHSRVIVWDRPEFLGTDYYNASYIDGYNGPKEYIASQGPNSKCLTSYWLMVWQEGVTCIVMATGLFENAVQQCDKYWVDHTRKYTKHGSIHIWHEQSTYLAQLNIRTFKIQKEGSLESRLLTHFEMVGFHDEGPDPGLLLDVRRRVNLLSATQPGPVLVHCRCGGGRTAVYIAVDFCLHQLHSEDRVDVYSTVLHLRRFRKNMVRTVSQYKQIYSTVAMYLQCGVTVYPADTLPAAYQVHYAHGGDSKHMRLEKEFQTLQSIVPRLSIGDCASGHRVENRSKSRDIMMLPPECARPYLTTADCGDCGTDFINAVYVDGYHLENSYLITQWPMKKTTGDLWRLMYDFKITCLVLMNDPRKFSRSFPRFWPKAVEQIACFGPISVRYLSCERHASIVTRTFAIRKPKRHPHLVAQVTMRIREDVMVMNNLIGYELRQDEVIVKMFQVLSVGQRGNDSSRLSRSSSFNGGIRHSHSNGVTKGGAKDQGHSRGVGIQSRSLLAVMEHVADWQKRSSNRQPVCVLSKDGNSRAGIYCAVSVCCDQVRAEREVDVFNAVRLVRKNRPQLVPTLEEYRYIYHFMTEFILVLGSKPDILVSEIPGVVMPHSSNFRNATIPMALSDSLHVGVYVVAKGKDSGNLVLCNKDDSPSDPHELQHLGQSGYEDILRENSVPFSIGSTVPCMLGYKNGSNFLQKEKSKKSTHICNVHGNIGSSHLLVNGEGTSDASHINIQDQLKTLTGKTFCDGKLLTCGQILSYSTLQPLGDIHHSPMDFSLIQNVIEVPTSSSSLQLSPPCYEPGPSAMSPSPFLTPEMYQRSRVFNGLGTTLTNSSRSPGSLCKSSSFFSCSSGLSLSSNCLGNGSPLNHAGNGSPLYHRENADIHTANNTTGVILHPALLNGHLTGMIPRPDKLKLDSNHPVQAGLSSSLLVSGLLRPELSNVKPSATNCDSSPNTLIHASYASLADSLSGSTDGRDHRSSFDWLEQDKMARQGNNLHSKSNPPPSRSCLKVNFDQHSPIGKKATVKEKSNESTAFVQKISSSTFSLRQKIKGYKFKKRNESTKLTSN